MIRFKLLGQHFKQLSFIIYLLCLLQGNTMAVQANTTNNASTDTIYVYDTIWTYETIYDTIYETVYVHDTVAIEAIIEELTQLPESQLEALPIKDIAQELIAWDIQNRQEKHTKIEKTTVAKKHKPQRKKGKRKPTFKPTNFSPPHKRGNHLFANAHWEYDMSAGVNQHSNQYQSTSFDSISFYQTQTNPGYNVSFNINYATERYALQTGIGIVQLNEKFDYQTTKVEVDSFLTSRIEYKIGTVYDSIFNPEYPWDSTEYFVYESHDTIIPYETSYYQSDTTKIINNEQAFTNHYQIEIPLVFSYRIPLENTTLAIKAGGVNQFHFFSRNNTLLPNGTITNVNSVTNFTRYNFALYCGAELLLNLNKNNQFGLEASYKYPLRNFSRTNWITTHKQSYSSKFIFRHSF